jgi:benzoyl-CoA 2,3-dioxygenase component B
MELRETIPNNVGLADKPRLKAALEPFRRKYLDWWAARGPAGFPLAQAYLRTPVGVDARGWAQYGYVRLPEYRWGLYQAEPEPARRALFGRVAGRPVFYSPPAELRGQLRKLLVTQGDTEPGSVEQSRRLGATAPSLYDLRNLFQINCEEGRHLWAMVHLLLEHFGGEGEDEAEGLLARCSGSAENPRLLQAFNSPIEEWLSFLFWSTLADRDGKYQLHAMSESAFDPLARTCRFMLTEEAHHMFVGDDGLRRVLQRTAELMRAHDTDDVAPYGGINLATFQRFLNYWAPQTIDLFGNELSSWAEEMFDAGIKARPFEADPARYAEHVALAEPYGVERREGERLEAVELPARKAINEITRETYLAEIDGVIGRWNRMLARMGIGTEIRRPDKRFNRRIGVYAGLPFTPEGRLIERKAWEAGAADWLPSAAEWAHVKALMVPCFEPGRIAGWIAPPQRGIDGKPALDFAYVRL